MCDVAANVPLHYQDESTPPCFSVATEPCVECDVAPATLKCEQCLAGQNLYCDICFKVRLFHWPVVHFLCLSNVLAVLFVS